MQFSRDYLVVLHKIKTNYPAPIFGPIVTVEASLLQLENAITFLGTMCNEETFNSLQTRYECVLSLFEDAVIACYKTMKHCSDEVNCKEIRNYFNSFHESKILPFLKKVRQDIRVLNNLKDVNVISSA